MYCVSHLRMIIRFFAIVSFGFLSGIANATEETGKIISVVGSNSSFSSHMRFTTPPSDNCIYNTVYIDITSEGGRALFSTVLTAYATGRVVSRIIYTKNADNSCWAFLVEI